MILFPTTSSAALCELVRERNEREIEVVRDRSEATRQLVKINGAVHRVIRCRTSSSSGLYLGSSAAVYFVRIPDEACPTPGDPESSGTSKTIGELVSAQSLERWLPGDVHAEVDRVEAVVGADLRRKVADFESAIAMARSSNPSLPLPAVERAADGALLVEWRLSDRRVGFAFEIDATNSGWYFVDVRDGRQRHAAGYFSDWKPIELVDVAAS